MAKLTAKFAVDFKDFDLNSYKRNLESQRLVENSKDKTNAGSDDRYTLWSDDIDNWAIAFHGRNFDYDALRVKKQDIATEGRVEAFSEWFYTVDPDVDAGEKTGRNREYLLENINVGLQKFIDAFLTKTRADDLALLRNILSGDDRMLLSGFDDRVHGYRGDDIIKGRGGNDVLFGEAGNDRLVGHGGNERIKGGADNDTLLGGNGDDNLRGQNGNDLIKGGQGSDKLFGGNDDDNLWGAKGQDTMVGGDGSDTFQFRTGDGNDFIRDFEGADTIDLSRLASVTNYNDLSNTQMSQVGDDVVIDGGDGDVLTLRNTLLESLSASDFIFA